MRRAFKKSDGFKAQEKWVQNRIKGKTLDTVKNNTF
jgi:hypothetical protein